MRAGSFWEIVNPDLNGWFRVKPLPGYSGAGLPLAIRSGQFLLLQFIGGAPQL
jgi:hypothetical protein